MACRGVQLSSPARATALAGLAIISASGCGGGADKSDGIATCTQFRAMARDAKDRAAADMLKARKSATAPADITDARAAASAFCDNAPRERTIDSIYAGAAPAPARPHFALPELTGQLNDAGWVADVPVGGGWQLSSEGVSGVAHPVRVLRGSGGAVIRFLHESGGRVAPDEDPVVEEHNLKTPATVRGS